MFGKMLNQLAGGAGPVACEDNGKEMQQAWDDVSGKDLKPELVRKARTEEMESIKKTNLYNKVPRSKATKPG